MIGATAGGSQQAGKTEFGFGWMKMLTEPSTWLNMSLYSRSKKKENS
jgi:hypothetical protein